MRNRIERTLPLLGVLLAAALIAAGCGGDDEGAPADATTTVEATGGYEPGSDVAPHAAIGADIAEIQALLEPAEANEDADFEAVGEIWAEGSNSQKSDGSPRTLAGFVEDNAIAKRVEAAIDGDGKAADLSFAERRQWIEKGISAALAVKILSELDEAAAQIGEGNTAEADGAPHDVDEAWAFYEADGAGLASTADKRAEDYGLGDEVNGPVVDALSAAQAAAQAGDSEAFTAAQEQVRGALNFIFALAVKKYLVEGVGDEVAAQEGLAFSWGFDGLPASAGKELDSAFGELDRQSAERAATAVDESASALGIERPIPDFPADEEAAQG